MKNSINNKIFQPITLYTSMMISLYLFTNSALFTVMFLGLTLLSGIIMAINIFKEKDSSQRFKNALLELMYCTLIYFTLRYVSIYIGNIYSSLLVITEYVIYLNIINPKLMNRKIFPENSN